MSNNDFSDEKYLISLIVCSYNPDYNKLLSTVKSFLLQKDISFEIVVVDDGSKNDYFAKIKSFFDSYGFKNYKFVKNYLNLGTINNLLSALNVCSGTFVKALSPGDYLSNQYVLKEWVNYNIINNYVASGSDYIPYKYVNKKIVPLKMKLTPVITNYSFFDLPTNYLINSDTLHGVAILCRKLEFQKYLTYFHKKIKYSEENYLRLMAYVGEKIGYYKYPTILYEYGTGLSTSHNKFWDVTLMREWDIANDMIDSYGTTNNIVAKHFKYYICKLKNRKILRFFYLIINPKLFCYKIIKKIFFRNSITNIDDNWIGLIIDNYDDD